MAHPREKSDQFNRDLLDDGVLRPATPAAAPASLADGDDVAARRQAAFERLRAEIQIGLDDYEAGLFYEVTSAEELFNLIMSDSDDVETREAVEDRVTGRS